LQDRYLIDISHILAAVGEKSKISSWGSFARGVLDGAPRGLSTAAMLMLFQFYFKAIKFNKLLSFVYEDNPHSLKGTLHIGFKEEGRFKKHVIDPRSNQYVNLIQTGLLAEDAFSENNKRLMQRLLS
jgi:hypothetical protein